MFIAPDNLFIPSVLILKTNRVTPTSSCSVALVKILCNILSEASDEHDRMCDKANKLTANMKASEYIHQQHLNFNSDFTSSHG